MAGARLAFKLAPGAAKIVDIMLKRGSSAQEPILSSLGYIGRMLNTHGYSKGLKQATRVVGKDYTDAYKYLLANRHYQLFGKEGMKRTGVRKFKDLNSYKKLEEQARSDVSFNPFRQTPRRASIVRSSDNKIIKDFKNYGE